MKTHLLKSLFITLPLFFSTLVAQDCLNPAKYLEKMQVADSCIAAGNYSLAYDNLNAAAVYCRDSSQVISQEKDALFNLINALKNEAQLAREAAEKNARASHNSALAQRFEETDPTLALNIAYYNFKAHQNDPSAISGLKAILDNVLNFYYRARLEEHTVLIRSLDYDAEHNLLLSGGADGRAILWDAQQGKALTTMKHPCDVLDAKISPDATKILTGGCDGNVRLWNMQGELLQKIDIKEEGTNDRANSVVFLPNGQGFVVGSYYGNMIFFNPAGEQVRKVDTGGALSMKLVLSPNGKYIVTSGSNLDLWDAKGNKIFRYGPSGSFGPSKVAISPSNKYVVFIGQKGEIYDLLSGEKMADFNTENENGFEAVSFSNSDNFFYVAGRGSEIEVRGLDGEKSYGLPGGGKSIHALLVTQSGESIFTGDEDGTIKILDIRTRTNLIATAELPEEVDQLQFKNNILYATTGKDGLLRLDLDGNIIDTIFKNIPISNFQLASKGDRIVTAGEVVTIWDAGNFRSIKKLDDFPASGPVSFSPNGNWLATLEANKAHLYHLPDTETRVIPGAHDFTCLAFSPRGKQLALGDAAGNIRLWNTSSGELILKINNKERIRELLFLTDSTLLGFSGSDHRNHRTFGASFMDDSSSKLTLWSTNGKVLHEKVLEGYNNYYTALALTPDAKNLIAGKGDFTTILMNTDLNAIQTLRGHNEPITDVAISDDGHHYATLDTKGTLNIWLSLEDYLTNKIESLPLSELVFRGIQLEWADATELENVVALNILANQYAAEGKTEEVLTLYQLSLAIDTTAEALLGYFENTNNPNQVFEQVLVPISEPKEIAQFAVYFQQQQAWEKAIYFYEKLDTMEGISLQKSLLDLYEIYEKARQPFDEDRFLDSVRQEFQSDYAEYFFKRENWELALVLYERLYMTKARFSNLAKIYEIKQRNGLPVPSLEEFIALDDPFQIYQSADFFRQEKEYEQADQLYSAAYQAGVQQDELRSYYVLNWYELNREGALEFDESLFTRRAEASEISDYASYFHRKEDWARARELYHHLLRQGSNADATLRLYEAYTRDDQEFDFSLFLNAPDEEELLTYVRYFVAEQRYNFAKSLLVHGAEKFGNPVYHVYVYQVEEDAGKANFADYLPMDDPMMFYQFSNYFRGKIPGVDYTTALDYSTLGLQAFRRLVELDSQFNYRSPLADFLVSTAWFQILNQQYEAAEKNLREAIVLDGSNEYIYSNLPHAILLQGRFNEAKKLYLNIKDQTFASENNIPTFKTAFINDFDQFNQVGIESDLIERMRVLLLQQ